MAGEWTSAKIEDVAKRVAMGPFGSSIKVETFVPQGIPVISGQHLHGCRLRDLDFNFVSLEHAAKLANANVRRGDVIFTHAGNIGQVAYIPESSKYDRYVVSQRQFYMRPDIEKVLPEFIAYYFTSSEGQHKLLANTSSSGVPSIAQPVTYLRIVEIPLPPLPEQRAIAYILSTLDDKIEINRRMNESLEAIARALFNSWFVNFDPVQAKAKGRDTGLPKHHADLFPDSFDASELGEIPKGWQDGTLADFSSLNPESWSKDTRPEVIHYVDLSNTKWGRIETVVEYSQKDAPSRAQRVLRPGDSIVGTVRPGNGSYALITERGLTGSTGFAVLRPLKPEYTEFVYLAATTKDNIEGLAHLADGGAYPAVRPEVVVSTKVVRPPNKVVDNFAKSTSPLLAKIATNDQGSRTLAALRDAILPKLVTGELRVKDADKIIGRHA